MQMSDTLKKLNGGDSWDFYRCHECGYLITAIEMAVAINVTGRPCPCGARMFSPANVRWYHWFLPRVLYFAYQRLRGVA